MNFGGIQAFGPQQSHIKSVEGNRLFNNVGTMVSHLSSKVEYLLVFIFCVYHDKRKCINETTNVLEGNV